jgi:hypothetical protein
MIANFTEDIADHLLPVKEKQKICMDDLCHLRKGQDYCLLTSDAM